jgi:hypothetical protein
MLFRPKHKDADPRERALWGELMSIGMVFPIAIALGFFGGRWIGGWFGYPAIGQWIGLAYGIATGFYELYKTTKRLDRMDQPPPPEPPSNPEDPKC